MKKVETTIVLVVIAASVALLSRAPSAPRAPIARADDRAHALHALSPPTPDRSRGPRPRRLDCGGSASTWSGSAQGGSINIGSDTDGKCTVYFGDFATGGRCNVTPGQYTVIKSFDSIEIVGGKPGETITYACK